MTTIAARNVVLGAGAMGAATAYHLARRGEPVLLVEQFALGHDRGSSHGAARITRHSYADPDYARLMPAAFDVWKTLEADAGLNLFLRTGGVSVCGPAHDYCARVSANLEVLDVPHQRMTGRKLRRCFPAFAPPDDAEVVFEPDAGMLAAARAVAAQIDLARELGGERTTVWENVAVRRLDLDGDRPTLETDRGRVVADRLVVAAGAWTGRLLPGLAAPLRPTRQQVLYFRPNEPTLYRPGRFPVFIVKGVGEPEDVYGMPLYDGLGVKVARHGGPDLDPDAPDADVGDAYREEMRGWLRGVLPGLAEAAIDRTEVCIYTVAPGDRFQVGPLPGRPDVIVASPCSGHGFKFSCLIGRVLADLAATGGTATPIDAWRVAVAAPA